jgi:hypothetical protein
MKSRKLAAFLALLMLAAAMAGCAPSKPFSVGAFDGNAYANEYFGMTFSLPDGWSIPTDEQIKEIAGITDEMLGKAGADLSKEETVYLAYAMKYPYGYADGFNPNMNIVTTNLGLYGFAVKSNSDFLGQALEQMKKQLEGTDMSFEFSEIAEQKIGGVDFAVVDSTSTYFGMEFSQRMLCTIRRNYAVMITFSWMGDDGIDDIQTIMDSLSFEK